MKTTSSGREVRVVSIVAVDARFIISNEHIGSRRGTRSLYSTASTVESTATRAARIRDSIAVLECVPSRPHDDFRPIFIRHQTDHHQLRQM